MTKKDVKEFIRDSLEEIKLKLMKNGDIDRLCILLMTIDVIQSELLSRLEKLEEGEEK